MSDAEEEERQGSLNPFTRDVLRDVLVEWVSKALSAVFLAAAGLIVLLIASGASVPAWSAALALVFACSIAFGYRRHAATLRSGIARRDSTIAELRPFEEEHDDLVHRLEVFDYALLRHTVYGQHLAEVIDHLQRVLSGDIGVSIPDYMDKGILQPARDVLTEHTSEDVRLSILLPDDDCFVMMWASGHNLNSQTKYRVSRASTLADLVFTSGEMRAWDDVTSDDRFVANPAATRPLRAMVACPLKRGDEVLGVFNCIASLPGVFDPAEETYLASLAGVLSVAVNLWLQEPDEATVD